MIPECYFKDPFPIQVPADYLSDCWVSESDDFDHDNDEWIRMWKDLAHADETDPEDIPIIEESRELYGKMVHFYMEKNFEGQKGVYAVVHDAHNLIKATRDDGNIRIFFKEFGIDFSHLFGNTKMDLQVVIIPFDSIDELIEMKDRLKLSNAIEVWDDGIFVDDTFE